MSESSAFDGSHNTLGAADDTSTLDTPDTAVSNPNTPAQRNDDFTAEQPHSHLETPASSAPAESPSAAKGKARSDSFLDDDTATAIRQQEHSQASASKSKALDATTTTTTTTTETATPPPSPKQPEKPMYAPSLYLNFTSSLDPRNIDINTLGILYEYSASFFIVLGVPHPRSSPPTLRRGFVAREKVGSYLLEEWASLSKQRIGGRGRGVAAIGGRWQVYSPMMQEMRVQCLRRAREIEKQIVGRKVAEEKIKGVLERLFDGVVEDVGGVWRRRGEEREREGQAFMDEFMDFGEDG